jgi:hypothetical protein
LEALNRTAPSFDAPPDVTLKGGKVDCVWAPQAKQIIQVFFHPRSSSYLFPQPAKTPAKKFC